MKTDEIKRCIKAVRNGSVITGADARTRDSFAAETELAAITERITTLEADNAARNKAILDGISNTYMLKEHCPGAYQEDAVAVEDIEAALSPPTHTCDSCGETFDSGSAEAGQGWHEIAETERDRHGDPYPVQAQCGPINALSPPTGKVAT